MRYSAYGVHWGMCLATYPFFRDVAAATGRLLALQESAALSQIVRRMAESWSERTTATRAVQRVVRSFAARARKGYSRRPLLTRPASRSHAIGLETVGVGGSRAATRLGGANVSAVGVDARRFPTATVAAWWGRHAGRQLPSSASPCRQRVGLVAYIMPT